MDRRQGDEADMKDGEDEKKEEGPLGKSERENEAALFTVTLHLAEIRSTSIFHSIGLARKPGNGSWTYTNTLTHPRTHRLNI